MKNPIKSFLPAFIILFYHTTFAQSFKIGTIDIYGNRKTLTEVVLAQLSIKEGDSISHQSFKSADEIARIKQIPGVKEVTVNPVCCDTAGNLMLYIGIAETDSVILKHRQAPVKDIKLPDTMINTYNNFIDQIQGAIKNGQGAEDYSHGYALINYQPARNDQNKFITFAEKSLPVLADVLKNSRYEEDRAAAADIIAYSADREKVVDYLLYATDDPDEDVRNNAARALGVLEDYLVLHPQLKITIPAGPFIRMINSIVWTDRNKGSLVLMHMTQNRDPKLLKQIKQQALASVIEMAKWNDRNHALPCFLILGRMAGIDDKQLMIKNFSKNWLYEVSTIVDKCR